MKEETNKLMANFMGDIGNLKWSPVNGAYLDTHGFIAMTSNRCGLFHLSHGWLNALMEKILLTPLECTLANGEKFSMRLRFNTYRIKEYNSNKLQIKVRLESDFKQIVFKSDSYSEMESTYDVALQFINWYNENH